MTTDRPLHVLFLCVGNSARSIMAESILNHLAGDRFIGVSAGSQPAGAVHPEALRLLTEKGHNVSRLRSKSWDDYAGADTPPIDFVVTVCDHAAAETCPIWPGHPMVAHWGVADPASVDGPGASQKQAFADAYDLLQKRITSFVSLPLAELSPSEQRAAMDRIGHLRSSRG